MRIVIVFIVGIISLSIMAAPSLLSSAVPPQSKMFELGEQKSTIRKLNKYRKNLKSKTQHTYSAPTFDFPVTYNQEVKNWIHYYQTEGKWSYKKWLERSTLYAPYILKELRANNLPKDLLYVAMIESGFAPKSKSQKGAVGIWQFMKPAARRYGLKVNKWVDERRNFTKATKAAIEYQKDLYQMFGSWQLVAASYNTGETRMRRLIEKHRTANFWQLSDKNSLSKETSNYVPKIMAATLIAQDPAKYGFKNIDYKYPIIFEETPVPGGIELAKLSKFLKIKRRILNDLNPDLLRGYIPVGVKDHVLKVPVGSKPLVQQYAKRIEKKFKKPKHGKTKLKKLAKR